MRTSYLAAFGLLTACLVANADSVTLQLDPLSGTVSGSPGDTVGWGYTLDNNTGDYLVVSYSAFCESGQDPLFTSCAPALGASSYMDFLSLPANFTEITPGGTASAAFDPTTTSGVGEYSIDPLITSGSDSGSITVIYDLFNGDPTNGGSQVCANPTTGVCDFEVSAAAEVDVLGATSPVPEPRLAILLGFGLVVLIIYRLATKLRGV
jgi:hypothetical protein